MLTAQQINRFSLVKLPSAYFCGVRVKRLEGHHCIVGVKLNWFNKNPFKSMFWAVQGMAAELSTGALVMAKIQTTKQPISMLVIANQASFSKKAKGKITFTCNQGNEIDTYIAKALETKSGQTFVLESVGVNEHGEEVSRFQFTWSIKVK